MSVNADVLPVVRAGESVLEAELAGMRRFRPYARFFKRLIDIVLTLIALIPAGLIIGTLALLIMIEGGRPFYSQTRIGLGGRRFRLFKLRTMCDGADALLQSYLAGNAEARAEWDRAQKLDNDPRITRIGRLIRRTSLDELPQLWNVLKGDMSLVGPRPFMEDQAALYPGRAYYHLRPGITGLWQVRARNNVSFADRARYDDDYARSLSLGHDLRLMVETVGTVIHGSGR